jgi:hypothetical protein
MATASKLALKADTQQAYNELQRIASGFAHAQLAASARNAGSAMGGIEGRQWRPTEPA